MPNIDVFRPKHDLQRPKIDFRRPMIDTQRPKLIYKGKMNIIKAQMPKTVSNPVSSLNLPPKANIDSQCSKSDSLMPNINFQMAKIDSQRPKNWLPETQKRLLDTQMHKIESQCPKIDFKRTKIDSRRPNFGQNKTQEIDPHPPAYTQVFMVIIMW